MILFFILLNCIITTRAQCLINDALDNIYLFTDLVSYKLENRENPIVPIVPKPLDAIPGRKSICFSEQYSNSVFFLDPFDSKLIVYSFSHGNVSMINVENHNTVTFYAVSNGIMYYCPVDLSRNVLEFQVLQDLKLDTSKAVIGFGENHLHFINLPGLSDGQVRIFVIHYAFLQEQVQTYGYQDLFPQTTGKTVIVLKSDNSVPVEFAFMPDDFSGTFIVDTRVQGTNSSVKYPPPVNDLNSLFVATTREIVQLTGNWELYTLDITQSRSTKTENLNNWIKIDSSLSSVMYSLGASSDGTHHGASSNDSDGTHQSDQTFSKSNSVSFNAWTGFYTLINVLLY